MTRRSNNPFYINDDTQEIVITYKYVEATSREQAEEFALSEDVNELEEYVEVEEDYDD